MRLDHGWSFQWRYVRSFYRAYLSRGRFRWRYRTGERRGILEINIPERSINVRLSDEELAERRKAEEARGKKAFTPPTRQREVSKALRAYGKMVSSADKGGVRIVED